MDKNRIKKGFAAGALILMLSNLIVKVIGALLKIPLTNLIGLEGMAYYNSAYQIYAILFLISTSGLPVAVSRLVAKSSALGRANEVKRTFKITLAIFFCIGLTGTLIMAFGAEFLTSLTSMPLAARAVLTISPTIVLICIVSAIRGYFQGLQNMVPTACSQLIESLLKLLVGFGAAKFAMEKGYPIEVVAAYAISGVTIGVIISTLFLLAFYLIKGRTPCENTDPRSYSNKRLAASIIRIAIPVSLTAAALYLANIVDLVTIVNILAPKFGQSAAELMYSAYSSISVTLANMPSTIIYAIAISALPALTAALALKQMKKAQMSMRAALRLTIVFSLPCVFGVMFLSKGIITCVYNRNTINEVIYTLADNSVVTALDISAVSLGILAIGIYFITLYSTTNALMQSHGLEWYTIRSVLLGAATKLVFSLILLNIRGLNIYGAAISTVLCYVVAVYMNNRYLTKKTGRPLRIVYLTVKPLIAALACGFSAWAVYRLVLSLISFVDSIRAANTIAVFAGIAVGMCVYFVILMLVKGIPESEIRMLPKGEKICRALKKIKLL